MSALAMISDSRSVTGQKLSAPGLGELRISSLEKKRKAKRLAQARLADQAGISESTYRRMMRAPGDVPAAMLDRLERALAHLLQVSRVDLLEAELIRSTYRGFVLALADDFGVTAEAVAAADPRAGATADPHWRACAHVRQAAIYLTNTALGLKQRRLADVLELTPAAVCLALKAVEDRRDDPALDATLRRASKAITGRDDE
jgi:transcriptional regulator with XRE-family HTH domain